jgi:agmatine deiminase
MYPADLNFRMPPEWTLHARTFMEWPVKEALWPEPFAEILPAFAAIVKKIARFEPVTLITRPSLIDEAKQFCGQTIDFLELEHNDSWMRDNGPTFVNNPDGEIAAVNWIFNGWGGKFAADKDNLVALEILKHLDISYFDAPFVMEGGSFHVDGEGTLLTTEECLLNKNRNPHLSRNDIETILRKYLNVSIIIWLKRGWSGDDTDGHIDNIACFAKPGLIITQVCPDPADPNYEISEENQAILKKAFDTKGRTFEIVEIEQPPAVYYQDMRLTLSYLNFYFVNGGIVMPVFGGECEKTDRAAEKILKEVFPDRQIVTIDGGIIARGGGNVHCLTQQMPAGIPAKLGGVINA